MSTYTFVVNHTDLVEASVNTHEPFKNLFITKLPSFDSELGYELTDDTLIVKYEEVDGERMIMAGITDTTIAAMIPTIYGIVLKMHDRRKLQIGKSPVINADVVANTPDGFYTAEGLPGGKVIQHPVAGDVFIAVEGFGYAAVLEHVVCDLYAKYVDIGHGAFIPDEYLIRFQNGERYEYVTFSKLFHDPLVAQSYHKNIPVSVWEECAEYFSVQYGSGK